MPEPAAARGAAPVPAALLGLARPGRPPPPTASCGPSGPPAAGPAAPDPRAGGGGRCPTAVPIAPRPGRVSARQARARRSATRARRRPRSRSRSWRSCPGISLWVAGGGDEPLRSAVAAEPGQPEQADGEDRADAEQGELAERGAIGRQERTADPYESHHHAQRDDR